VDRNFGLAAQLGLVEKQRENVLNKNNRGTSMKEYKIENAAFKDIATVANQEAKDNWRVSAVLPHRLLPAMGALGLELAEVVILFERGSEELIQRPS
jgi:hypothetical protein